MTFHKIVTGSYPLFIAALLGGIGFTISLFISGLSFASAQFMDFSKLGIIMASVISGILGLAILYLSGEGEE